MLSDPPRPAAGAPGEATLVQPPHRASPKEATFEWCVGWDILGPHLDPHGLGIVRDSHRDGDGGGGGGGGVGVGRVTAMVPGAGTSELSAQLHSSGYYDLVTSVDFDAGCTQHMAARHAGTDALVWATADVCDPVAVATVVPPGSCELVMYARLVPVPVLVLVPSSRLPSRVTLSRCVLALCHARARARAPHLHTVSLVSVLTLALFLPINAHSKLHTPPLLRAATRRPSTMSWLMQHRGRTVSLGICRRCTSLLSRAVWWPSSRSIHPNF
jgi:hypothetical protein